MTNSTLDTVARRVHRIEVRPVAGEGDPVAAAVLDEARQTFGFAVGVRSARVFLIEAPLDDEQVRRIADELLADPVSQTASVTQPRMTEGDDRPAPALCAEVHYQPGVMDPVAQSTREAIVEMFPGLDVDEVQVRTGVRYDLLNTDAPPEAVSKFAQRALANTVIHEVHLKPFFPDRFPEAHESAFNVTHVSIRELDDEALTKMSRDAHLFLSLDEMRAIRDYFRQTRREPTDIELETLAQTWSEHCVHKTLKSTVHYTQQLGPDTTPIDFKNRPGHEVHPDGSVTIHNLLKSTVAAATNKLMESDPFREWCVSVFKDNSGIVKFDDEDGVCIKVETHNHPSAIEPYGGAATGIGGCIRDVMGTGLAAKPIANTDTFCVAHPEVKDLPKGVIPPKRILKQVVAGVRDYGNRMGIPTVNGSVYFHNDYLGNPLVFAGCVGLIPLDKCFGRALPGDRIIALGGRTGRDGIHGATFSSAELTDTHADEFAHAVQIGNAITQKKTLDVILQARDPRPRMDEEGKLAESKPLFNAITDCGAGGFSSAVGEMGSEVGANVVLDHAPLKYAGLSYTEVWISEAQERMVLAVPPQNIDALRALCEAEGVEMCDLGQFGWHEAGRPDEPVLALNFRGQEVGRLSMHMLHEGIPTPTRKAHWSAGASPTPTPVNMSAGKLDLGAALSALLAHPNIASKHWIIRQYDHEVQGGSVVKPLTGPMQLGPSDASVLRPKHTSKKGIALGCGLQTGMGEKYSAGATSGVNTGGGGGDSYEMVLAAIDEAVRNVVCVGADVERIAILDNFCWPRCDDPKQFGSLVRAAEACYDGALAYRTPFVSGKDSLSNQFTTEDGKLITIPPTMLITALGIVPDITRCVTMDAKQAGNLLFVIGNTTAAMGGSHHHMRLGPHGDPRIPRVDLRQGPLNARAVASLISRGLVRSAHDCSDGGLLVAAAEMAFAGGVGLDMDLAALPGSESLDPVTACFAETPSRYLLEIAPASLDATLRILRDQRIPFGQVGTFARHDRLTLRPPDGGQLLDAKLTALRETWRKPLDW
ncbi:MAG: phosphoribosylformylglycinamidine synthase [Phycisphaera sp.]|nr:phosphoribosylformylglycinamidine synthase [Phycisphaera sp.]